jgi:hypothetical protein
MFVGGERPDAAGPGLGALEGSRLLSVRPSQSQTRQRSRPAVQDDPAVIENLLKLASGSATFSCLQVCLSEHSYT